MKRKPRSSSQISNTRTLLTDGSLRNVVAVETEEEQEFAARAVQEGLLDWAGYGTDHVCLRRPPGH